MVAELATYGLSRLDEAAVLTDSRSGFPVVRVGRRITSQDVDDALDGQ